MSGLFWKLLGDSQVFSVLKWVSHVITIRLSWLSMVSFKRQFIAGSENLFSCWQLFLIKQRHSFQHNLIKISVCSQWAFIMRIFAFLTNLAHFISFLCYIYVKYFPGIFHSLSGLSEKVIGYSILPLIPVQSYLCKLLLSSFSKR